MLHVYRVVGINLPSEAWFYLICNNSHLARILSQWGLEWFTLYGFETAHHRTVTRFLCSSCAQQLESWISAFWDAGLST